jgi:hypothetical protein
MELQQHERDPDERTDVAAQPGGAPHVTPSVGELTDRELDLQRRLVRESLLLLPA